MTALPHAAALRTLHFATDFAEAAPVPSPVWPDCRSATHDRDLQNALDLQRAILEPGALGCRFLRACHRYRFPEAVEGDLVWLRSSCPLEASFLIADVTGHGVSAAMFTPLLRYIVDIIPEKIRSQPSLFLNHLDDALHEGIPNGFLTAIAGCFRHNPFTEETLLVYANAAHPAAVHLPRGNRAQPLARGSCAIGLLPGARRPSREIVLRPGDRLYAFTDGFTEIANPLGEAFGEEKLISSLEEVHAVDLDTSLDRIFEHALSFADSDRPADDMTLLGFECLPSA